MYILNITRAIDLPSSAASGYGISINFDESPVTEGQSETWNGVVRYKWAFPSLREAVEYAMNYTKELKYFKIFTADWDVESTPIPYWIGGVRILASAHVPREYAAGTGIGCLILAKRSPKRLFVAAEYAFAQAEALLQAESKRPIDY